MGEDARGRLRGVVGAKGLRFGFFSSAGLGLGFGFADAGVNGVVKAAGTPRLRLVFVTFAKGIMVECGKPEQSRGKIESDSRGEYK